MPLRHTHNSTPPWWPVALLLACLALASAPAKAQGDEHGADTIVAAPPIPSADSILGHENAIFWKVTGNGLKKPSYIFGTSVMHNERFFALGGPRVVELLKQSGGLLEEWSISPKTQDTLSRLAAQGSPAPLAEALPADGYDIVTKLLSRGYYGRDTNLAELAHADRLLVLKLVHGEYLKSKFPNKTVAEGTAMHQHLRAVAVQNRKRTIAFDDGHWLVSATQAFQTSSYGQTVLSQHVYDTSWAQQNLLWAFQAYQGGNLADYYRLTVQTNPSLSPRQQALRHEAWLQKLPKLMRKRGWLIAIDVAHLAGPSSLIKALRAEGYTVVPEPLR